MSVVPGGLLAGSSYAVGGYSPSEAHMQFVGRDQRSEQRTPVLFCHGFSLSSTITGDHRDPSWTDDFKAIAGSTYPVLVADQGGGNTWANPTAIAAVSAQLAFLHTAPDVLVRDDKVALFGESMGGLLALNWAWRNANKVRAVVLRAPVVAMEDFRTRNAATFGAAMDAAYGGSISSAEYDAHDPMRNLDLIEAFGDRILIWYGEDDEYIPPAEIEAFAELVGATAIEVPDTTHVGILNTRVDKSAMWLIQTIRARRRSVIDWQPADWGRFDRYNITPDTNSNTNVLETVVGVGGRRGQYRRATGPDANQRELFLLREMLVPDMRVKTTWFQDDGGPEVGQHGTALRGTVTGSTYLTYMLWSNILFGVPWIVNVAAWTGTVGVNNLTLPGLQGFTIPGLRLAAGGDILASSRSGNVVTLVIDDQDAPHFRSGVIDVVMAGAIGNYSGVATLVDDRHIQYTQAGADVVSGGAGTWADFGSTFPFEAEAEVYGNPATIRARFWIPGTEAPVYGDPDWSISWVDSGAWGPTGYGRPGLMAGHVGIFHPVPDVKLQWGMFLADEL